MGRDTVGYEKVCAKWPIEVLEALGVIRGLYAFLGLFRSRAFPQV